MPGMADEQDVASLLDQPLGLPVHLGNQRAGCIHVGQAARLGGRRHRLGHAVGREDHRPVVGDFVELVDEHRAERAQAVDDKTVVNDLVTHIDRRTEPLERELDDLDRAIDVTATMTQLRSTCQDAGNDVVSTVTFTVLGLRRDAGPARQLVLPYFDVALRGGSTVAAKQIGAVALNFPAGSQHAYTRAQATIRVSRYAATLPANVRAILTRPRKAGQAEAAIDPLADPAVRSAVANATFEHLVGFELTPDQLKYNATR